jgi:Protein of unknown function (DUF2905)
MPSRFDTLRGQRANDLEECVRIASPLARYGVIMPIGRLLIIFGVVLIALGLLWPVIAKIGIGRLPGDIVIERDNFRLYVPLATSLLISVVLSLLLWLLNR